MESIVSFLRYKDRRDTVSTKHGKGKGNLEDVVEPELGYTPAEWTEEAQKTHMFPAYHSPTFSFPWRPRHMEDFAAAGIAAATNVCLTYPVFKAIVRIQVRCSCCIGV